MSTTPIALSGFNGLDTASIVSSLIQQASQPIVLLQSQQQGVQSKIAGIQTLAANVLALRTAADNLVDPTLFSNVGVTSSASSAISAAGAAGAAQGAYSVNVTTLAQQAVAQSQTGFASDQAIVGTGSLTINVGSSSNSPITIDSNHQTLAGIRDSINAANVGVTASIVNTGNGATPSYLVLTANTAGASNTISVSGSLNGSAFGFNQVQPPQTANLTVNGVAITSNSNTVTGAIPGVTLNLNQQNSSSVITVSPATSQISSRIQALVTAYNALNTFFTQQATVNQTTKQAGVLTGDSTLATVRTNVHQAAIATVSTGGAFSSLADIGLEFQKDGSITINSQTLNAAIQNNLGDVKKFLQGDGTNGFALQVQSTVTSLSDPLNGILPTAIKGLQGTITNMQNSIDEMQARIDLEQTSLTAQFTAAQQAITQLNSQSTSLGAILGSISSSSSSGSSL